MASGKADDGFFFHLGISETSQELSHASRVHLQLHGHQVVMSNGLVTVTFSNPAGMVTGIQYDGMKNVLETANKEDNRGYWDVYWDRPFTNITNDKQSSDSRHAFKLPGTKLEVIVQNDNQVEIAFVTLWNGAGFPLNVDKRYIMLRGSSGFYSYAIFERSKGMPEVNIYQARIAFKLQENKFHYMAISDKRQRVMPTAKDRRNAQPLDYPEAVRFSRPGNPSLKGEVDDKYQYSCDNKDNQVHGWISDNPRSVGFWIITPSNEFQTGGPLKQDLTSHVGPTVLSMFVSTHYAGKNLGMKFRNGERWKKVFGPVFVYLNSASNNHRSSLWHDAKSQGYQFWTQADRKGNFMIKGIRPGLYNLFAWVPGVIGDYKYGPSVKVASGSNIRLSNLVYEPPRTGPTLWEIGTPDRVAAEFFVPDPKPALENHLYDRFDKFRQYGLWNRYAEIYPRQDLVYTVGVSNYSRDWFFAHVTRHEGDGKYTAATWKVLFEIKAVNRAGNYTLRVALASANEAELQVRVNDESGPPIFSTGLIGKDNAIARHGIHGLYWLYGIVIPGFQLYEGRNTIFLTQSRGSGPFKGLMYDYIRLETTWVDTRQYRLRKQYNTH
ncbi:hypothetical protein RHMOL_Rhmol10G0259300 [Rhododendron molle]|uniref:Uncharacterized protein n=1 Tax=Rhododendron molle TaxID=49168 RepID=A0ACC0M7A5_RHOML|nr:hypothetical protein RHMOL_Rhmol10G0259300 [Rhododendron molle]